MAALHSTGAPPPAVSVTYVASVPGRAATSSQPAPRDTDEAGGALPPVTATVVSCGVPADDGAPEPGCTVRASGDGPAFPAFS